MIAETGSQITHREGWLNVGPKTRDERLVGASSRCGCPLQYLSLLPTPVTWDSAHLMRQGMKWLFQTRDDKGRKVKSHLLTFTYPE